MTIDQDELIGSVLGGFQPIAADHPRVEAFEQAMQEMAAARENAAGVDTQPDPATVTPSTPAVLFEIRDLLIQVLATLQGGAT